MLKISVQKQFADFELQLDLIIQPAFTALFGPSGSGKTTTLNIIAGLTDPTKGEIVLESRALFSDMKKINLSPQKRNIGYIFQESRLFPHLNVKQNMEFGLPYLPKSNRQLGLEQIVEVTGVEYLLSRTCTELSGGEKQRVALARALLASPKYLLMDEPLAALDWPVRLSFLKFLKDVHTNFELPIIYVSHDLSSVLNFADQVIIMQNGKSIGYGAPYSMLDKMIAPPLYYHEDIPNIFEVTTISHDESKRLTHVKTNGINFILPHLDSRIGEKLLLNIPASEIILAKEKPVGLSASNILSGRIYEIYHIGERVLVEVDSGSHFTIEIVPPTVERLELRINSPVYLIIKASSFRRLGIK